MRLDLQPRHCRLCLQASIALVAFALAVLALKLLPLVVLGLALGTWYRLRFGQRGRRSGAFGTAQWATTLHALHGGLFSGRGLLIGRFHGAPLSRGQAALLLFTLPASESELAVRLFLDAFFKRYA